MIRLYSDNTLAGSGSHNGFCGFCMCFEVMGTRLMMRSRPFKLSKQFLMVVVRSEHILNPPDSFAPVHNCQLASCHILGICFGIMVHNIEHRENKKVQNKYCKSQVAYI